MEAARTSETLVNFYQTTRRYNPEDSHLHTHRRENLKSYLKFKVALQLRIQNIEASFSVSASCCYLLRVIYALVISGIKCGHTAQAKFVARRQQQPTK
jgi:hypothetical protein